jgi:hypothetical protein
MSNPTKQTFLCPSRNFRNCDIFSGGIIWHEIRPVISPKYNSKQKIIEHDHYLKRSPCICTVVRPSHENSYQLG